MISNRDILEYLQSDTINLTEDLIIILGPTASGKTKLAVELAQKINAEIISVDSRQVYRKMNIGTGKDLSDYKNIPYHLIDIVDPGEHYNISRFLHDFHVAFNAIKARRKIAIVCGGTGFYLQALLDTKPYIHIPVNEELRLYLKELSNSELIERLHSFEPPSNFKVDFSSNKRIIRAIEIATYLNKYPHISLSSETKYTAKIYGLNPRVEIRRKRISERLQSRLTEGMIEEVEDLIKEGVTLDQLEYYGLEYKYISYYLKGDITYNQFYKKLETEIHRYAKRQMTFFRSMEKSGFIIDWL